CGGGRMDLSVGKILFASLPESLLLVYVGLGLWKIETTVQNYILIAVLHTIILVVFRNFFSLYGYHSLILSITLSLLIKFTIQIDWQWALVASLSGFLCLVIGDSLVLPLVVNLLDISVTEIIKGDLVIYCLISYLIQLPLWITAAAIYVWDLNIINVNQITGREEYEQVK
ncbi:MAG: hypothetical protein ACQEQI_09305, partial [Bacillota bacterium]